MSASDAGRRLRDGALAAGWNATDLWIAAVALGGNLGRGEVDAITSGDAHATRAEYGVLAAALNEQLVTRGLAHRVPAWAD